MGGGCWLGANIVYNPPVQAHQSSSRLLKNLVEGGGWVRGGGG